MYQIVTLNKDMYQIIALNRDMYQIITLSAKMPINLCETNNARITF